MAIPPVSLHQKECSKNSGWMPSSSRRDVVEDPVGVVGAVVVAHAGVVATHDEVRAAVVLAQDRVQHGLARTGVAHRRRQHAQHHPLGGVVALDQHLVAAHPHVGGDVVALGLAHQRVEEEPVHRLQRHLGDVLVGAVDRVAGLEADDAPPAAGVELLAGGGGGRAGTARRPGRAAAARPPAPARRGRSCRGRTARRRRGGRPPRCRTPAGPRGPGRSRSGRSPRARPGSGRSRRPAPPRRTSPRAPAPRGRRPASPARTTRGPRAGACPRPRTRRPRGP